MSEMNEPQEIFDTIKAAVAYAQEVNDTILLERALTALREAECEINQTNDSRELQIKPLKDFPGGQHNAGAEKEP